MKIPARLYYGHHVRLHPEDEPELLKDGEKNIKALKGLRILAEQGREIRIWYSNSSMELCGYYYLCHVLRDHDVVIHAVELPAMYAIGNKPKQITSWGMAHGYEYGYLIENERTYTVGILELIEGERTQEKMETDNNNQLKKIAEYSDEQNHMMISKINKRDIVALIFGIIACIGITLFTEYRNVITLLSILVALAVMLVMIIYNISVTTGYDKKRRDFEKKHPKIGYAYIALLIFFAFSVVKDVWNIMHFKL